MSVIVHAPELDVVEEHEDFHAAMYSAVHWLALYPQTEVNIQLPALPRSVARGGPPLLAAELANPAAGGAPVYEIDVPEMLRRVR